MFHGRGIRRTFRVLALLLGCAVAVSACGLASSEDQQGAATSDDNDHYPVTVENCGKKVTFEKAPERVLLLRSNHVEYLDSLGVMDRVVAKAGAFPRAYYDDQTNAKIADIRELGDDLDARGHLQISEEVIIGEEPDLVLGLPDGVSQEGLAEVGIPSLMEPAYCPSGIKNPGFDDVYAEMEMLGKVFDREAEARKANAELRTRVKEVRSSLQQRSGRTAAVLFPTVGGGVLKAYGSRSMSHPQLEAAGFENAFGDVDERLFEVTQEELLERDPDVLILLHVSGKPGPVKDAVMSMPGAAELTAVRNDDILVQLFNFSGPPTPVSLAGLERIGEHFGGGR